jgi:hypothetical protein
MTNQKTTNWLKKILNKFWYLAAIGASIFALMFIISATLIGYDVKDQCRLAQQAYSGDCVEALITQLDDENAAYGTRNSSIWALGQLGDSRALPTLQRYYTGIIPKREKWDEVVSQYELKKAINLAEGNFNIAAWVWRWTINISDAFQPKVIQETVILSDPDDSYYTLAKEIADAEQTVISHDFTQALSYRPKYILWVASPDSLSEEDLWTIGDIFKRMDFYPAMGIISGDSTESARQLYQNGKLTKSGISYLGSDVEVDQQIMAAVIVDLNQPEEGIIPLTKDSLIETLAKSDFFYWVRHVSVDKWMWMTDTANSEDGRLMSKDIPELGSLAIITPSCGSFQPWREDSIAMGFVNHGAAAYLGHVHTSVVSNSFLMRKGYSIPGASTWKEFPLGIQAQVRRRMEGKVTSATPLYFMLGDPRAYLSDSQPYTILSDKAKDGTRTITGETDLRGYLALKVEDGAGYDFTTITGLTSISENDLFFNNYLQSLDLGGDKYLLFYQEDGDFEITLKEKAPFLWVLWDGLMDALDYNWITIGVVYAPISLAFLALLIIILTIKLLRKKVAVTELKRPFAAGILFAGLHIGYTLLRMDKFSASADLVSLSPIDLLLGFVGYFSTISAGFLLVKGARKKIGEFFGWVIAILPQVLLTIFKFGIISITNVMFKAQNTVPKQLWNFNSFWISAIALVIDLLIAAILYRLTGRSRDRQT